MVKFPRTIIYATFFAALTVGSFGLTKDALAYATGGKFVSTNLLSGETISSITGFTYDVSALPANTSLEVRFSKSGNNWFDSAGTLNAWDTLSSGENTIDLTSLDWTITQFYYQLRFTSDGVDTPVLDSVSLAFTDALITDIIYEASGSLTSTNLLSGEADVQSINSFDYNISSLLTGAGLTVQFSQDNSTWFDSSGVEDASDTLSSGDNSLDLSALSWGGSNLYYKASFTSNTLETPILDQVSVSFAEDSLAGTVYSDSGSTPLGSQTVRVAINGSDFGTTAASDASTGAWSIDDITLADGDILTVYLEDETADAVTVTISDGQELTGLDLYQDHLIIRQDNSGSLTNANLSTASVSGEDDVSGIYSVSSSDLTLSQGKHLFIPASHTFAPGGDISLSGDWTNNGSFTAGSSAVIFTGASQTISGSTTFNDFSKTEGADDSADETLTFAAGATQTITGTWTIDGRDADDRINLVSGSPGTAWIVNPTAFSVDFADVTDSNNTSGTTITCPDDSCVDGGGNTGWDFDTIDPSASNIAASVSQTDATITWTTNEVTSSQVEYGQTTGYGFTTAETNISPRLTSHSVTITVLSCGTLYHYRVKGEDASDNSFTGADNTFSTSECPSPSSGSSDQGPDPISEPNAVPSLTSLFTSTAAATDILGNKIITVELNREFTVTTKPVDADRLKSLTLIIGQEIYELKPTGIDPDNPTYSATIKFTTPGLKTYTLRADYGITDRKEKGQFKVVGGGEEPAGQAANRQVNLAAPAGPNDGPSFPNFGPALEFEKETEIVPLPDEDPAPSATAEAGPPEEAEEIRPLTPEEPTVFDKLGLAVTDTLTAIGGFFASSIRTTGTLAKATLTSLDDLFTAAGRSIAALGRTTLALFKATGTFIATLTTQTVAAITDQQQTFSSALASAYKDATRQASSTLTGAWQQTRQTLTASRQHIAAALKPSPAPDPRIPEHLQDHRYEEVQVRIALADGTPLSGAHLTLLSEPKESITDDQGFASFQDVEIGEHTLKIAFGKFKGEQHLFFRDDVPKLLVNVTPSLNEGIHPAIWIIIAAVIGILGYFLAKRRFTGHFVI